MQSALGAGLSSGGSAAASFDRLDPCISAWAVFASGPTPTSSEFGGTSGRTTEKGEAGKKAQTANAEAENDGLIAAEKRSNEKPMG